MLNGLRFIYIELELFFEALRDGFFCETKAMIVIAVMQIYILFFVANTLFLLGIGMDWYQFNLNRPEAYMFGLMIFVINDRVIKGRGGRGLANYREIFAKIPRVKKVWGGVAIVAVVTITMIGFFVTLGMVAEARRSAGLIQ